MLAAGLSLLASCAPEPDFMNEPAPRRTLFANNSSCGGSNNSGGDEDPIDDVNLDEVVVVGHQEPIITYDNSPGGPCIICGGGISDPGGYTPPSDDNGNGGDNGGGYNPGNPSGTGTGSTAAAFDASINGQALQPCMATILAQIKNISSGQIANIIQGFSGHTPGFNWTLQNGSLPPNTYGSTVNDAGNHRVVTTFDASLFANASDLSVARTMMHESVHAYLVASFQNNPVHANQTYPQLLQAFLAARRPDLNALHHDQMVATFVQEIAYGLQQYGQQQGYSLSNDFYIHMAWGGLEGTRAFQSLGSTQQQHIRDTIRTELTGQDAAGNTAPQKGSASGC